MVRDQTQNECHRCGVACKAESRTLAQPCSGAARGGIRVCCMGECHPAPSLPAVRGFAGVRAQWKAVRAPTPGRAVRCGLRAVAPWTKRACWPAQKRNPAGLLQFVCIVFDSLVYQQQLALFAFPGSNAKLISVAQAIHIT